MLPVLTSKPQWRYYYGGEHGKSLKGTSKGRKECSEKSRSQKTSHTLEKGSLDYLPGPRASFLGLSLSQGGRGSLAPLHPAPTLHPTAGKLTLTMAARGPFTSGAGAARAAPSPSRSDNHSLRLTFSTVQPLHRPSLSAVMKRIVNGYLIKINLPDKDSAFLTPET